MVTQRERARTTDFAKETFHKYLTANDLAPALICTSSIVYKRLKTLLVFRLKKDDDDWKKIHENLNISFGRAVNPVRDSRTDKWKHCWTVEEASEEEKSSRARDEPLAEHF